jgi:aryl-alcohol dehydrogenase-like predicted oxidoreductase
LIQFAETRGHTLLELAMSWLACEPTVASVIAGAKSAEQVQQNAKAVNWQLSADETAKVDAIMA